jgi:toxin ParE1/3/4
LVQVNWTLNAKQDLKEIGDYISHDSPGNAKRFVNELSKKPRILLEHPQSGRIVPEFNNVDLREIFHGNYRIIYKIKSLKRIDIIRVYHSKRLLKTKDL